MLSTEVLPKVPEGYFIVDGSIFVCVHFTKYTLNLNYMLA